MWRNHLHVLKLLLNLGLSLEIVTKPIPENLGISLYHFVGSFMPSDLGRHEILAVWSRPPKVIVEQYICNAVVPGFCTYLVSPVPLKGQRKSEVRTIRQIAKGAALTDGQNCLLKFLVNKDLFNLNKSYYRDFDQEQVSINKEIPSYCKNTLISTAEGFLTSVVSATPSLLCVNPRNANPQGFEGDISNL